MTSSGGSVVSSGGGGPVEGGRETVLVSEHAGAFLASSLTGVREPVEMSTVVCADGTGTYRRSLDGEWRQVGVVIRFDWNDVVARVGDGTPCWILTPAPGHWTIEDRLMDMHARYHDEAGNLLGRDECGSYGCEFWDAAGFVLSSGPSSVRAEKEQSE